MIQINPSEAHYEKVIDALTNCTRIPKCQDCPWEKCEDFDEKRIEIPVSLLDAVKTLLKKEEPLEPVMKKGRYFTTPHCGRCGTFFPTGTKPAYCSACGQAAKWEVEG